MIGGDACRVEALLPRRGLDAAPSQALREHGLQVAAGDVVVVDTASAPARIVYLFAGIHAEPTPEGFRLSRRGEPVSLEALAKSSFPPIRRAYQLLDGATADDLKRVVREGYDRIADRYVAWVESSASPVRARYTEALIRALPAGAPLLDLGCGAGGPTTRALAAHCDLTGVDVSPRSVDRARQRVPGARFLEADMCSLELPPESFAAVAAFFSLIHVPRDELGPLLEHIASWLRPGGWLVASLGVRSLRVDFGPDFFGAPMVWSSHDRDTNLGLVERAGLAVVEAREEEEREHGRPVRFLWVRARKPGPRSRHSSA